MIKYVELKVAIGGGKTLHIIDLINRALALSVLANKKVCYVSHHRQMVNQFERTIFPHVINRANVIGTTTLSLHKVIEDVDVIVTDDLTIRQIAKIEQLEKQHDKLLLWIDVKSL